MAVDVIMPKLGESITEGTILEWKKSVGDMIDKDETLLEISTDKVDSEVPCPAAGKVLEVLYKVNDVVAVGEVIARVGGEGETASQNIPKDTEEEGAKESNDVEIQEKVEAATDVKPDIIQKESSNTTRFYSPLVKSIAEKEGVSLDELETIPGSGANNRINKNDILAYMSNRGTQEESKPGVSKPQQPAVSYALDGSTEPMGHMRKMISKHMIQSRDTSVHVYSTCEVDITDIVNFRNANKDNYLQKHNTSLTYTPFFIDAVIRAINDFPLINASTDGENVKYNENINIGVAVALPDNNLIVPVIKRSEEFNFLGLSRATADFASRARQGKLDPDEVIDSTFTVTNPGIFGSLFGMGIINQPNVSLLSVGSIHKRPVVKETEFGDVVVVRSMVYLTLAYDHRLIDGAYGTQFLSRIKELLENFPINEIKI